MSAESSGIMTAINRKADWRLSELIEATNPGEFVGDLRRQWYIGAIAVSNETIFTELLNHTISLPTFATASDEDKRAHLLAFARRPAMEFVTIGRSPYYGM
jgi:hypothetical protein